MSDKNRPDRNPDDNVSKNSNTASPGRTPDKASPYQGGEKIHGDKMEHHDEAARGPTEQNRGQQRGQPDQRNNQPNNPGHHQHPQDRGGAKS